jgi:two-component system phosphate regulon response regulator PhoB
MQQTTEIKGKASMKVMVVEDEHDIRDILKNLLEEEGFEVVALENGLRIMEELRAHTPDLLLLDQMLPGKTGVEAVREVRASEQFANLPIILVTGLSGEDDKVNALDLGADDYVTKPFYPKELAARIKALARRSDRSVGVTPGAPQTVAAPGGPQDKISRGPVNIDFSAHRVTVDNQEILLTLTEFKILGELLKQSGQVLTREKLRERALGNLNVTDRTIDVHMASLRKKLGGIGHQIETVRGVGYRFSDRGH